jgi:hypothetical protein
VRRVLMVSPHFPPDTTAGTHRVRLFASHLGEFGWEPVVVSIDPDRYEGEIDRGLLSLVPAGVRVVRSPAWSPRWTRRIGIGDLGIRAYTGLRRTCARLLERERFDALFITLYPTYPAMLGPLLKRKFAVPFVLDYQDPWIGSWGETVGGGRNGRVDFKSRATRRLARWLEPHAVSAADAITAVSTGTYEAVAARYPQSAPADRTAIPIGGDPADFDALKRTPGKNGFFDPADGCCHVSYVGTLLPLGVETLRSVLQSAALLKTRRPDLYARLRLHFFGTSNQVAGTPAARVTPVADSLGVSDCVTEWPRRIPYLDALRVQLDSQVLLLMGSNERHYTASKIYPALLAQRPLLAVYHEASSVSTTLPRVGRPPSVRLITFGDAGAGAIVERIYEALVAVVTSPVYDRDAVDVAALDGFSARAVAAQLAAVLDRVATGGAQRL